VGSALAAALGWRFVDADDYHDPAAVAKMARGVPLDDRDRGPWLDRLHALLADAAARGTPLVLACSALKASYRERLAGPHPGGAVRFVFLAGPPALFRARLEARRGHYMHAGMLDSQVEALEPPGPDEALTVDASLPPAALVAQIRAALA
jgi:gluconokinase